MSDPNAPQEPTLGADPIHQPTEADAQQERRTRRRRVATVEVTEEAEALAVILGKDPADLIQALARTALADLLARVRSGAVAGGDL